MQEVLEGIGPVKKKKVVSNALVMQNTVEQSELSMSVDYKDCRDDFAPWLILRLTTALSFSLSAYSC